MHPLWTVAEAVAATGGRPEGLSDGPLHSVSIDSREIGPEALFVAIKGDKLDGHDYVRAALDAGAAAAIVSEAWFATNRSDRVIVVPDTLEALRLMAKAARLRSKAMFVAVTGSAGKTTTKEAIRTVLGAAGETHYSIKSFNNHWGVPLMLARMPREAQFGVFEIGMNHAGEITPLTRLVRPHVVVITTVAAAHLEFFKSVSEIAEAKAEIFLGVEEGGTAVLNADHPYLHILFAKARESGIRKVITYGYDEEADWRIGEPELAGARTFARVTHGNDTLDLNLQVRGRHMVANATAALAVAALAGVDRYAAQRELADFGAPEGRGETTRLGPADKPLVLIDESYNANVASMNAAMEVFAGIHPPGGKKLLVLGDMLELGPQGAELHQSLSKAVLGTGATQVFLVGRAIESLAEVLGDDRVTAKAWRVEDVMEPILSSLALGDAVMIKGSKGVRLALLIEAIKRRFAATT
ncbi:MAG: UDP-N-acetylmuramoyl-tripeptide--D-alanyl-D-alanine ligase [Hyphomicrobiales bacterium]|nr:MAG: UDP-N-acetylmuramoyl-tripeptide--D-alanyl-D-alanine ligase [Hyphomicrobiales bacterium]